MIDGPFAASDRVVVIEDVTATRGFARRAIEALRGAGARILGVLAVVDREEGWPRGDRSNRHTGHLIDFVSEILALVPA